MNEHIYSIIQIQKISKINYLKYLINCNSWAVGREVGSLDVRRDVASCSGIGTRGSMLCTESSN